MYLPGRSKIISHVCRKKARKVYCSTTSRAALIRFSSVSFSSSLSTLRYVLTASTVTGSCVGGTISRRIILLHLRWAIQTLVQLCRPSVQPGPSCFIINIHHHARRINPAGGGQAPQNPDPHSAPPYSPGTCKTLMALGRTTPPPRSE